HNCCSKNLGTRVHVASGENRQPISHPTRELRIASRFTCAIDSARGMEFGQAFTQFWALAQSCTPPAPRINSKRSRACMAPVGCILKRRTWLMIAAPTKLLFSFICGQTSRQMPQVMHLE